MFATAGDNDFLRRPSLRRVHRLGNDEVSVAVEVHHDEDS